ncbi:MAG TPA: hypothetical protein PK990_09355, partial [Salinivirgaceae bacterium]|nr:hypothetical protein [Salinivirgaceae bacterium]
MIRFKTSFFKIWLCLPICFFAGLLHKTSYVKGQENVGRQYDVLIQNPQILNAPQVVFLRQKNLMVYQTSEIYRGIDVKFPLKKTVTQFLFYHNDSWENTPMLLSDGAIDLILLGGNPINNILLLTDSKTRSRLYLLELNNKRTPVAKPVENFNNGGFPIHSATINQSGDVIIFSSARFGTHGGYDLFVAELSSKRRVTQIKNAGTKTNSPFDEIYPRFADENNHLYFATNFTSTPGFFQTIEARFENNQIIPISRFLPTDPSLNSICEIQ